jgi:pimeloyl-ACP methyl ester carboxylesterase
MKKRLRIIAAVIAAVIGVGALAAYAQLRRSVGETFDSNGVPIFYSEKGEGEPVILVHGFGVHGDLNFRWPGIIDTLATDYRVITMDARGHGKSGKPHERDKYGMECIEDIKRLMDHLEIERAHLVGYSMGGLYTLKFMTEYPDRLITAAPCGNGWHIESDPQYDIVVRLAEDLQAGRGYDGLFELIEPLDGKKNPITKAVFAAFLHIANDELALGVLVDSWRELAMEKEDIERVTLPTLCLIGEDDPFRRGAERLADVKSNHELVLLENRDHYDAFEGDFAERILAFLHEHPADGKSQQVGS